jgi:hypothetical protein
MRKVVYSTIQVLSQQLGNILKPLRNPWYKLTDQATWPWPPWKWSFFIWPVAMLAFWLIETWWMIHFLLFVAATFIVIRTTLWFWRNVPYQTRVRVNRLRSKRWRYKTYKPTKIPHLRLWVSIPFTGLRCFQGSRSGITG